MRGVGRKRVHWLLLGTALAVVCLSGVLIGPGASRATTPAPVTLRATFSSFPDYLDPALSYTYEGWTAMNSTYIPLLTFRHANGRAGSDIVPGLATDLPEVTDGGRTYTLFLRRGLRYSDGTPVRASDFEYAIKRALKLYSPGSSFYLRIVGAREFSRTGRGGIKGIFSNDRSGKIEIHLTRPSGTFTDALALYFAAPVPKSTPMRDQSLTPPPATGPYAIVSSSPGVGWSYARNPAWGSGNGALLPEIPAGYVDRVEVTVIRNASAQVREVIGGKLDWMQNPPPANRYRELRSKYAGTQLRAEPSLNVEYFWMNTTKAPFDDLRVREAANFAVDASVLRRIYGGQLAPSQQILSPGMPGYRKFVLFPHNLAKARRLVAAADPVDRNVTVWTTSDSPGLEAAGYYRAQLRKIGLRAHLKVVGADSYFAVIGDRSTPNLDTGWGNWYADYPHPDDFFGPLLSGSSIRRFYSGNFSQLDVPSLDARIERLGEGQLGPGRERAYAALDRSFMKRAPWVPYGNRTLSTLVSKAVDLERAVWNPLLGIYIASLRFK